MSGTVLIGCPTCGRRYRYDAGRFGTRGVRIRCRTCEAVMRVDIPVALQPDPEVKGEKPAVATSSPEASSPVTPAVEPRIAQAKETHSECDQQEPAARQMVAAADDKPAAAGAGLPRALVAELDPVLRQLFTDCLQEEGYQVQAMDDGLEVRRFLAGWQPNLVILNVFLPKVLGVTLCSEIKRHPLLQETRVLLVGSLYRRDRFMRHPGDLYGADEFLDGNGIHADIRGHLLNFCRVSRDKCATAGEPVVDEWDELARLARIVVGDIILYNPRSADVELAAGTFLHAFAEEIREGEGLVTERFSHLPDHVQVYHQTVKDTVAQHCSAAGMHPGLRT